MADKASIRDGFQVKFFLRREGGGWNLDRISPGSIGVETGFELVISNCERIRSMRAGWDKYIWLFARSHSIAIPTQNLASPRSEISHRLTNSDLNLAVSTPVLMPTRKLST